MVGGLRRSLRPGGRLVAYVTDRDTWRVAVRRCRPPPALRRRRAGGAAGARGFARRRYRCMRPMPGACAGCSPSAAIGARASWRCRAARRRGRARGAARGAPRRTAAFPCRALRQGRRGRRPAAGPLAESSRCSPPGRSQTGALTCSARPTTSCSTASGRGSAGCAATVTGSRRRDCQPRRNGPTPAPGAERCSLGDEEVAIVRRRHRQPLPQARAARFHALSLRGLWPGRGRRGPWASAAAAWKSTSPWRCGSCAMRLPNADISTPRRLSVMERTDNSGKPKDARAMTGVTNRSGGSRRELAPGQRARRHGLGRVHRLARSRPAPPTAYDQVALADDRRRALPRPPR